MDIIRRLFRAVRSSVTDWSAPPAWMGLLGPEATLDLPAGDEETAAVQLHLFNAGSVPCDVLIEGAPADSRAILVGPGKHFIAWQRPRAGCVRVTNRTCRPTFGMSILQVRLR